MVSPQILALAVLSLLGSCDTPARRASDETRAQTPARPNVLLILADDLGWTDLGHAGSGYYRTPHLDRLAADGLRFTDAYANAANCAPTRAALLSGLHAARTGVYTVGSGARGSAERRKMEPPPNRTTLDSEFLTLAEALLAKGYRTGFVGKWHLGSAPDFALPEHQGFEWSVGGDEQGHPPSYFHPYARGGKQLPGLEGGDEGEYLTDRLTDEALGFLDADDGRPWFLMVSHYAVHTPIQAPEATVERFRPLPTAGAHDDPTYAAMVAHLDSSVGRLLARLDAQDATRDTLVVFTSDNGGLGGYREAGVPGSPEKTGNAPLRGGKGMFTEGGIRVPLLVRWPGHTTAGTTCAEPVQSFDLYPTLLTAAGGTGAGDGIDLAPLFRDPAAALERGPVYWHFPGYLESGRRNWRTTPVSVIREGPWKLLEYHEDGHLELYHLSRDVGEANDLSDTETAVAARLRVQLHRWLQATEAPMPVPLDR